MRECDSLLQLAAEYNRMGERLRQLHRSDMGKLVVAQQIAEAAIDSLYDPVIVSDEKGCVTKLNNAAEELFGTKARTPASISPTSHAIHRLPLRSKKPCARSALSLEKAQLQCFRLRLMATNALPLTHDADAR
ncbi:MAG: PAS domain-containing protein [Pyrinomonadaceae bacterium]